MEATALRRFSDILDACGRFGKETRISVAVAQDEDVLRAVKDAREAGIADAILVGDERKIRRITESLGLTSVEIVDEPDEARAARRAALLIKEGQADILMKGLVNSSDFMRALLDPEAGLKTGSLLSHLAVFEVPGQPKLYFHTDGGINISPDLAGKRAILENALGALARLGILKPKVAVLSANERVNPKMQSTLDAQALVEMGERGELPPCIIEGPIAMDVAVSRRAAEHKGIPSAVSGDVDLFLFPNIEAGNMVGKTLVHFAQAKMVGVVLGAACPAVLTSRSDTAEDKLYSIALASLMAGTYP